MSKTAKTDVSPKVVDENMYSEIIELDTLTGINSGEEILNIAQFRYHYFQLRITNISGSLVVRPLGTLDESLSWFNIANDGLDITYTANGTYLLSTTRGLRLKKLRLDFISGSGTLETRYRGGN